MDGQNRYGDRHQYIIFPEIWNCLTVVHMEEDGDIDWGTGNGLHMTGSDLTYMLRKDAVINERTFQEKLVAIRRLHTWTESITPGTTYICGAPNDDCGGAAGEDTVELFKAGNNWISIGKGGTHWFLTLGSVIGQCLVNAV